MSPRIKKKKRELVQGIWPSSLRRKDFELSRVDFQIYAYQREALKNAAKFTNKTESELHRDALDQLLFKKRRDVDVKAREQKELKFNKK